MVVIEQGEALQEKGVVMVLVAAAELQQRSLR